ncbi:hypothetical protein BACT_0967 [Bifidobacterium actinocoloniiforme DSM 22766]|uniref:TPM domain-containing protein n=1 Tax=Bifidobacterium actinocoloniiforme DSM 22766 TaxID=1437605 RepID=A0A086Z165_9BIFI|nr:hypothetical protein BACT_0967 [Bifidobacterium actinocoloniiforme DSM 22766]
MREHVVECGTRAGDVDKRSPRVRGNQLFTAFFACLLVVFMVLLSLVVPTASARAAGSTGEKGEVGALTDQITDTQNLLGSNVGAVTDAINETQSKTGVHVRLLYLPSFYPGSNPDKWASQVLESTKPPANTVLLAVASKDGRLVVAVSANSDAWLKEQSTVDDLSQAALGPISDKDTPDWVGSAQALMRQVDRSKSDHERRTTLRWVAVGGVVLALLVAAAVIWWFRRRRQRKRLGRHSEYTGNAQEQAAR